MVGVGVEVEGVGEGVTVAVAAAAAAAAAAVEVAAAAGGVEEVVAAAAAAVAVVALVLSAGAGAVAVAVVIAVVEAVAVWRCCCCCRCCCFTIITIINNITKIILTLRSYGLFSQWTNLPLYGCSAPGRGPLAWPSWARERGFLQECNKKQITTVIITVTISMLAVIRKNDLRMSRASLAKVHSITVHG